MDAIFIVKKCALQLWQHCESFTRSTTSLKAGTLIVGVFQQGSTPSFTIITKAVSFVRPSNSALLTIRTGFERMQTSLEAVNSTKP